MDSPRPSLPSALAPTLTLLIATLLIALLAAGQARPQREAPAPRSAAGGHIAYAPHQYRGLNLWISRSLGSADLWNRFPGNREAIEVLFAHSAARGVNTARVFLDYSSFLFSRLWESPSDKDAYARKVRELCDLADRYEIGLIPVFFTAFGANPSFFAGNCSEEPGPTLVLPSHGMHGSADVLLNTGKERDCAGKNRSRLRICLSPPSGPSCPHEIQRVPGSLFDDEQWLLDPAVVHGMHDYVDSVARAIGPSRGLLHYQIFNEAFFLETHRTGHGRAVAEVLKLLVPGASAARNPHGVPASISAISYLDFTNAPLGLVARGFDPFLFAHLVGWCTHVWPDGVVRADGRPLALDSHQQHRWFVRARNDATDPGPSVHAEHAREFGIDPGPHAAFSDAACGRNVSLQVLNDLLLHNGSDTPAKRQGAIVWSLFPSDVGGGEGGPIFLPGGSVLSWREAEALRDNWRLDAWQGTEPAGVVARGFGDELAPLLLTAGMDGSEDFVALAVFAENFDPRSEHGSLSVPPADHPARHSIFAVAARVPPAGPITWSDRATVTGGPGRGPLLFDESRDALMLASPMPGKDSRWGGPEHPEVEGGLGAPNWSPLLRADLLVRQKIRSPIQPLEPRGVYAGKRDGRHVFWLAWCMPVTKTENRGERCLPEDDAALGVEGNAYFSPFKEQDAPGGPRKYEVVLRRVEVSEASPPELVLGPVEVLATSGVRGERFADGKSPAGTGRNRPATAEDAGAAAIDPRLAVSPEGDLLVLYRKSQDSWFDLPLSYPDGVDAEFERKARWSVYPWEVFAQVRDARSGKWVSDGKAGDRPLELRVSPPWPGAAADPLGDWLEQVKVQTVRLGAAGLPKNGPLRRRLRVADFFPAIEPEGVIWREAGGRLRASVAFQQLATWTSEREPWRHPSGYELMRADWTEGGLAFGVAERLLGPGPAPADPAQTESREGEFVHGLVAAVLCPARADPVLAVGQRGRSLHVIGGAGRSLLEASVSHAARGSAPIFFVASHRSAADGEDGMVCVRLVHAAGTGGESGTRAAESRGSESRGSESHGSASRGSESRASESRPATGGAIVLEAMGLKGSRVFPAADRRGIALPAALDFEARIVGVEHTGSGRFRVAWHQGGELFAADLLLAEGGMAFDPAAGVRRLAGSADPRVTEGPEPHLRSGKLHASMTSRGVLFTHRGFLRFVRG